MSKQRIASNFLILISGQLATWVLSLACSVLVSRYLGPVGLGELTLATSISAILGLVISLGMDTLITRTVARNPQRGGTLVSAGMLVRGILSLPTPLILFVYTYAAHLNAETSATVYVLALSMTFGQFAGVLQAAFQGHERMSFVAYYAIAHNGSVLLLSVLVIKLRGGVVALAGIIALVAVFTLVLNLYWALRVIQLTWHISWADVREVVVGSLSFWANGLFLTFYIYVDSVILGALAGTEAVGFYAPPTRLFNVALFIPTIVGAVTMPMLSRLGVDAGSDFDNVGRKTLSLLMTCAIPLTVGLVTFAGPIIRLVFGTAYDPSVSVLMVLALCIPCTFLNVQLAQMMAARDQQWRWTAIMVVSCVANPLLNLIMIPIGVHQWHNGAMGAAAALLMTEVGMAVYGSIVLRRIVFNNLLGRTVLGALLAGSAQAETLWLVGPHLAVPGEIVGGLIYLVVVIGFGTLPIDDVRLLLETALRRPLRVRSTA